jgi:cyclopropane fatty-acyl-phospholipid synthase-like methyltransferase
MTRPQADITRQYRADAWEAVAPEFTSQNRQSTIGVSRIRDWADQLPDGAAVLDLGCGPGSPRSEVLDQRGFSVTAIDAAPSLAAAYRERFPQARVISAPVEDAISFDEAFDGVLACGLIFLLPEEKQRVILPRVAAALKPGGRLLFTAPQQICTWEDVSTGQLSISLGATAYRSVLVEAGLIPLPLSVDEGENNYFEALKPLETRGLQNP